VRRLLVSVGVLLALLLVADRVAAAIAEGQVASRMRAYGRLSSDPSVSIGGFPFLTQALQGRYDHIDVSARDLDRRGVRLASLDATLLGARIDAADAIGGKVTSVPVEGLRATAVVAYVDLVSAGDLAGARVTPADGGVRVTASLTVLGRTVSASALSSVRLDGDDIVVTARSVSVEGGSSAALEAALAGRLDLRVPVGRMPYGLELTGVRVSSSGLVLSARTEATVLTSPR
jgi:hypothetical protein